MRGEVGEEPKPSDKPESVAVAAEAGNIMLLCSEVDAKKRMT